MAEASKQRGKQKQRGLMQSLFLVAGFFAMYLVIYMEFYLFNLEQDRKHEKNPQFPMQQQIQKITTADDVRQAKGTAEYDESSYRNQAWYKHSVPKVIWQTSKFKELPPEANATVGSWRSLNPDHDYHLFDDADVEDFFKEKFPGRVYDAFSKLPLAVMKADMWRLAIVYYYGGVYADLDTLAKKPINNWIGQNPECEAYIGQENYKDFCNWAFAAVPRHPVFKRALYTIVEKVERDGGVHPTSREFVHGYTGPTIFTHAIRDILNATDVEKDLSYHIKNEDPVAQENAKKMKLCLFNQHFYNGLNANNKFASIFWKNRTDLYSSWTTEMRQYWKDLEKNRTKK